MASLEKDFFRIILFIAESNILQQYILHVMLISACRFSFIEADELHCPAAAVNNRILNRDSPEVRNCRGREAIGVITNAVCHEPVDDAINHAYILNIPPSGTVRLQLQSVQGVADFTVPEINTAHSA
ncbi:hypothetical protein D3C73_1305030 [compost metagenome]